MSSLSPMTAWILLLVAGCLEVVWVLSMKVSQGFTRHGYSFVVNLIPGRQPEVFAD